MKYIHPIVRQVVNRHHVADTDLEVFRAVRNALSDKGKAPENLEARKEFYRQAYVQHKRNLREYAYVMNRVDIEMPAENELYADPWRE